MLHNQDDQPVTLSLDPQAAEEIDTPPMFVTYESDVEVNAPYRTPMLPERRKVS